MNRVRKGAEPSALTTYRLTPDAATDPPRSARYDGPGFEVVKPVVRKALVAEQRGVCCYCTDVISATDDGMKIEHRVPQRGPNGDESRDLDWSNLLGACRGEVPNPMGQGSKTRHCDSSKGDKALSLDPTDASHVAAIGYERTGRVTSTRRQHDDELERVLNLNADALIERRSKALLEIKMELRRKYGMGAWSSEGRLTRLLTQLRDPPGGQMRAFSGFLCWWLERAIRKSAKS